LGDIGNFLSRPLLRRVSLRAAFQCVLGSLHTVKIESALSTLMLVSPLEPLSLALHDVVILIVLPTLLKD
jgi:hypothetical protein